MNTITKIVVGFLSCNFLTDVKKLIVIALLTFSHQLSIGQDTISLLSLAQQMESCAPQFRSHAQKQGFKFSDYAAPERGFVLFDNFYNKDSIQLIRSYSPKTVIDCRDRVHQSLAYVPGTKNFSKLVYNETLQMIKDREGTDFDCKHQNDVELKNVPLEIAMKLRDKFLTEGAVESLGGCFTTEHRKYYCTGAYTACFDATESKDHSIYSIRLYKNY